MLSSFYREMSIGFGYKSTPLDVRPGLRSNSWGYHSEDGRLYHDENLHTAERYGEGDVISCGVDLARGTARFAKNGTPLGETSKRKRLAR